MVGLAAGAFWLVGPEYRNRQALHVDVDLHRTPEPDVAVTGHA